MITDEKLLIAFLINYKFERSGFLISHFLSDDYYIYSKKDIQSLDNPKEAIDFNAIANFSNCIYEMPVSFDYQKKEKYLWQELNLLFNFKNILFAKSDKQQKNLSDLSSTFKNLIGEEDFIENFKSSELLDVKKEFVLSKKSKFKDDYTDEDISEFKDKKNITDSEVANINLIEKTKNVIDLSSYSNLAIWGFWKNMFNSKYAVADFKSPYSFSAFYYASFSSLLDETKWSKAIFTLSQLQSILENSNLNKFFKLKEKDYENFSEVSFKVQKLDIQQTQWFTPQMFEERFWNLKDEVVSDGKLNGTIPSYIDEVIFIKEINSIPNESFLKKGLRWIGELFFGKRAKDYPKFFSDINENDLNNIYLVGFVCKVIPNCPNPDPSFEYE